MNRNEKVTDEALIRNFQDGAVEAYDELVERYKGPLLNFIYRIINDYSFAQDLLQETFFRLYLHKDSYREIAKFSTWIYTIAGNLAKTELRRRKVRRWIPIGGNRKDDLPPIEFADDNADPHRDFERGNIQERVEEEISFLPIVFREAVILRDIQELSYDEPFLFTPIETRNFYLYTT